MSAQSAYYEHIHLCQVPWSPLCHVTSHARNLVSFALFDGTCVLWFFNLLVGFVEADLIVVLVVYLRGHFACWVWVLMDTENDKYTAFG